MHQPLVFVGLIGTFVNRSAFPLRDNFFAFFDQCMNPPRGLVDH